VHYLSKKKKKKIRWGRVFGALILASIFMVGLYTIYQYIEGKLKVLNEPLKKVEKHTFQGSKTENKLDAINVLLLGSDSRGEEQARTDTIMVAHYDPKNNSFKLISLMRDMLVTVPGHGQQKLNAAYSFGGPELLRQTIKDNFDLDIHNYAIVDFQGFEKAVDLLVPNGIEVDVPYEMSYGIDMTINEGKQRLHGKELLGYVRFRHDRLSDFGRIQRQQEVISKLQEEALGPQSIIKLPELAGLVNKYLDTNMDSSTLMAVGKDLLTNNSSNVETLRIPEDGSFENKRFEGLGEVLEVDLDQNKETLTTFLEKLGTAPNEE
jgi:polyisoprenyl-teichoic acid--peptidoglycan teichoic acid transferase